MIPGWPAGVPEPPPPLAALLAGARTEAIELGEARTHVLRLQSGAAGNSYLKILDRQALPGRTLTRERDRLAWLAGRLPAPAVLGFAADDRFDWLLVSEVPGTPVCEEGHGLSREERVTQYARGLRLVHALPVDACPFDERLAAKLERAERRLAAGLVDPAPIEPWRPGKSLREILDELHASLPPPARVVVCHGDYCEPNVLLRDGVVSGFIDLGDLGVEDPEYDVAIALGSLERNGDGRLRELFFAEYGVPGIGAAIRERDRVLQERDRLLDEFL